MLKTLLIAICLVGGGAARADMIPPTPDDAVPALTMEDRGDTPSVVVAPAADNLCAPVALDDAGDALRCPEPSVTARAATLHITDGSVPQRDTCDALAPDPLLSEEVGPTAPSKASGRMPRMVDRCDEPKAYAYLPTAHRWRDLHRRSTAGATLVASV